MKAVFLDRDGVINKSVMREGKAQAPYSVSELMILPGVPEAITKLKSAGFLVIVVTNQPDVARGWVRKEQVVEVNDKLHDVLNFDGIKVCFHDNADNCNCRKPRPGMLLEAAKEWYINLNESYMIGDRYSDVAAGFSAGCGTILIGHGDERNQYPEPQKKFDCLLEAALWIIEKAGPFREPA